MICVWGFGVANKQTSVLEDFLLFKAEHTYLIVMVGEKYDI